MTDDRKQMTDDRRQMAEDSGHVEVVSFNCRIGILSLTVVHLTSDLCLLGSIKLRR